MTVRENQQGLAWSAFFSNIHVSVPAAALIASMAAIGCAAQSGSEGVAQTRQGLSVDPDRIQLLCGAWQWQDPTGLHFPQSINTAGVNEAISPGEAGGARAVLYGGEPGPNGTHVFSLAPDYPLNTDPTYEVDYIDNHVRLVANADAVSGDVFDGGGQHLGSVRLEESSLFGISVPGCFFTAD